MIVEDCDERLAAWLNRLPPPLLFCRKIFDLKKQLTADFSLSSDGIYIYVFTMARQGELKPINPADSVTSLVVVMLLPSVLQIMLRLTR